MTTDAQTIDPRTLPPELRRLANATARAAGYGRATAILHDPSLTAPEVREHTRYGYRKYTTGQYVPNRYRTNFGWRNTYYQPAKTTVALPRVTA